MDPSALGSEASREELSCLPVDLATNKASSSTPAPTPPRADYDPQNAEQYNPYLPSRKPVHTEDDDKMRRKLNLRREVPTMAPSAGFLADVEAIATRVADATEAPISTIFTASAPTVLAEHDDYVRSLDADRGAVPSEFLYKRSKRDKRKSKARFTERRENLQNLSWRADLEELHKLAKKLRENQKQWSDPDAMMKRVMAKMKKEQKKGDKDWYKKMLAGEWKSTGPTKKLRRTIDGWEEVDIEEVEAEVTAERKQLRKRRISPYDTWKWNELSSSDEAEERERRVIAAAIKMFEKPVDSNDEDDEPVMHSLLSDDEAIATDPPLRTKEEKAREKAEKQEAELIQKERKIREELRPLLHPFFRHDKSSTDNILHAGALTVEVLNKSQFFPVQADVRKQKAALYKQKYEEKMAIKAKKDKVKRNRAAKKHRRFEARREKRSAYAHRLAAEGWDFPMEALTGYEDAITKAGVIPVMAVKNTRTAPIRDKRAFFESATIPLLAIENSEPENADLRASKQLLPTLSLAPEYARDPAWTFPVWNDEMAWTEYDTLPGRFEAISKIIKDDDWNDQFVKGSKLDQELMRTIVVPVWNAMTYEERSTVIGGQRVHPACFWSDHGDEARSYVSGSPKIVDPFDIEGSDWVPWSHPSESDLDSIKLDMSNSNAEKASLSEGDINEFNLIPCTSCTDKVSFDERERNVSDFLESIMSSSGTQKASFDEDSIKESDCVQPARSYLSVEKSGFNEEKMKKSDSPKSTKSSTSTENSSFGDGAMHESRAIVQPSTTSEDSFGSSDESARSSFSLEKASFEEGEPDESDSWKSASFSSNIQRRRFYQEETDGSPDDPQTPAAPENSIESSVAFDKDTKMLPRETLLKEVNLSDFEESLDNSDPDLDLNMLFQRVGAFCEGKEASGFQFNSGASREAELIFNLLRKEAVVRHWLPERTFSYENATWKTRVSILDPENKEAMNPAVFPPIVKKVREEDGDGSVIVMEYFDPERMDLSIPGRNNVLQERPDMQMNWLAIADEYRLGLNGRQRHKKPEWAKSYDLIRAQQPDPLIYMPKDALHFEEVGYFSEVLPKPLVFSEATEEMKYTNQDWIWQKHAMDQRIGLRHHDQRPDPNVTISDESYSGLIGDNLPPDDQSFYTNGSIRGKRSSGVPSFEMAGKIEKSAEVPDEVFAKMLKELQELDKPIPATAALGRPPPVKYIQPDDTPAAVLMKVYQEEYGEFRKECPEPTSIRFERELYVAEAPILPEKKAKQEMDDYLAQMEEEERSGFLKDVAYYIMELVVPEHDDVFGSLERTAQLSDDFDSSFGSTRRKLDLKPKLKVDELDMEHAAEDMAILGSASVTQKTCTPVAPPGSDASKWDISAISAISQSLSRRSEKYRLRDMGREKPSPRAPPVMHKAPSVLSAASGANLNRALDASKARILQKMKDRGESAEKQASMAATLDNMKHSEPAVPETKVSVLTDQEETREGEELEIEMVEEVGKAKPAKTHMTPAKARTLIDSLIDSASTTDEDELKENIIRFFGERFFMYAMTELDLPSVDVSEEEVTAYLQQRYEAHRLIEEAEEAKAKQTNAKEIKSAEPMSKREAQYLFEATMTPEKARALLDWAKRTQPSLYIKHMLAPGLLEYCATELDGPLVAVTQGDCMNFITWNMKMRESGRNLMELHSAIRVNKERNGEDKTEFGASPPIPVAKSRAMIEWLSTNRPDAKVMKLLHRGDVDRIICANAKDVTPVEVTENEAIAFFNLLSKRAMEISRAQRESADETFSFFEEETQKSNPEEASTVSSGANNLEDGSQFGDTFENDPNMSPELAVQLIAWVLDVRPDCDPECVLGEHFIMYVSQYQGPELGPLEDDEAFPLFKKYALAQQVRTGRIKILHEGPEQKPNKEDDACSDVLHRSSGEESVLEKFPDVDSTAPLHSSGSEISVLEKFPDIDIDSPPKPQKTPGTIRLRLKPSQVREFVEYLKSIHGHCDFKDKDFERMIRSYVQLPDDAPTKDFPFKSEALDLFKRMFMAQLIAQRKRQRAFDEGRVAYAYGAGTDPDIRRGRGEQVEDDEEDEFYNPHDDMYDGISRLFGSMSSISQSNSPRRSFKGSSRGSSRGSSGDSFGESSINEWQDLSSEASGSIIRRSNRGLFIRKRLSHAFDPIPDDATLDSGRLHLRRNPLSCCQHEGDRNEERSSPPLMSSSPGGLGLGFSLPKHERNESYPQSPIPARRRGANRPLRAFESGRSSPVPQSENSDRDEPGRSFLEGRDSQSTGTFSSRARAETPPPASFASWPSEENYQNSTDWSTGSSASMTFSQFQAMRRNYRLEEANMSSSLPPYGANPFNNDAEADNAGRDEEDDELSDMEAYESWYNARHGVSPEELEEGRRYFQEEQMIDEMADDPEMLEKVLGILAKIDVKVAEAHAQVVEEARKEVEKETALRGGVPRMVDDDPAHLLLHALDPKKEFTKTLLKMIDIEHLDAEEIEMLLEKIDERDEPSEYKWVDENGDPLEESDWEDEWDEEDEIDQDYHVQEHQERMQLNFEQCEYEGALARVEAWRDAHEEHSDPDFPQREREADEARKAEDEKIEAIVKAWEASKASLTVPHRKHGRRLKAKTLHKKEKVSLGNAQNSQGPFPSEPETLCKKEETPFLEDQTFQGSVHSRRAPQGVSFQVAVEDEPLEAEQRLMVAGKSIPQEEELSRLKSFESGGHGSKDADIRGPSPTPSLRSASDEVSKEAVQRKKNLAAHLGFKSKDMDVSAPSPTSSIRSVSRDVSGMPSRKLTKTRKPSADVASLSIPSLETFSPRPSMAPSETAPGSPSLVQRMASSDASIVPPSAKKSIKARLGLKSKDLNTAAPSPTPSFRSVSYDLPRRASMKLTKKRKLDAEDTCLATPSRVIFSPTPSMVPSENAPRSASLGQRVSSIFKRKDAEEENETEESGSSMIKRMKSLKFIKRKD